MRLALAVALVAFAETASGVDIQFVGLCPGAMRVERSRTEPMQIDVYCVGQAAPALTLPNCPPPAKVTTRGKDRTISCVGAGFPVTVRTK